MAKKVSKRSTRAVRQNFEDISSEGISGRSRATTMDRDYKEILRDLASNPAVRYVAGGIATAVFTKIATNLAGRYPEISNFIKENLDNVEGRLGEFKNSLGENARH